jgi:hypothetical protein
MVEICQLVNMEQCWINCNKIEIIPAQISNLTNLRWLQLSDNQVTEIPLAVTQLTRLQSLFLANNKLQAIPNAIGGLASLQHLTIKKNGLQFPTFSQEQHNEGHVVSFNSTRDGLIFSVYWKPSNHRIFPRDVRDCIKLILLGKSTRWNNHSKFQCTPKDVIMLIFSFLHFNRLIKG